MKFTFCKTQYLYLLLAIISICLALATRVFAEEPAPVNTTPESSVVADPFDTEVQTERSKSPLPEVVRINIQNMVDNVTAMMRGAANRFLNISKRLETRIEKMKMDGVDTQEAEKSLAQARTILSYAYKALDEIPNATRATLSAEKPRETFPELSKQFRAAREALREAHQYLRMTTKALREAEKNVQKKEETPEIPASPDSAH